MVIMDHYMYKKLLGSSWARLGLFLERLGTSWGRLGGVLSRIVHVLCRFGDILGRLQAVLGTFGNGGLGCLRTVLERPGGVLGSV